MPRQLGELLRPCLALCRAFDGAQQRLERKLKHRHAGVSSALVVFAAGSLSARYDTNASSVMDGGLLASLAQSLNKNVDVVLVTVLDRLERAVEAANSDDAELLERCWNSRLTSEDRKHVPFCENGVAVLYAYLKNGKCENGIAPAGIQRRYQGQKMPDEARALAVLPDYLKAVSLRGTFATWKLQTAEGMESVLTALFGSPFCMALASMFGSPATLLADRFVVRYGADHHFSLANPNRLKPVSGADHPFALANPNRVLSTFEPGHANYVEPKSGADHHFSLANTNRLKPVSGADHHAWFENDGRRILHNTKPDADDALLAIRARNRESERERRAKKTAEHLDLVRREGD